MRVEIILNKSGVIKRVVYPHNEICAILSNRDFIVDNNIEYRIKCIKLNLDTNELIIKAYNNGK